MEGKFNYNILFVCVISFCIGLVWVPFRIHQLKQMSHMFGSFLLCDSLYLVSEKMKENDCQLIVNFRVLCISKMKLNFLYVISHLDNPTQYMWFGLVFRHVMGWEFLNLMKSGWVEKTPKPDPCTPLPWRDSFHNEHSLCPSCSLLFCLGQSSYSCYLYLLNRLVVQPKWMDHLK